MRKLFTISVLVALMGALIVSDADAQRKKHRHRGEKIMEKLDLTVDQREKVEALKNEMKEDLAPIKKQMKALHKQIHELWKAYPVDEDKIVRLSKEMAKLHQKVHERKIEFRVDVIEILTPEQREKRNQLMEQRKERRKKHRKQMNEAPMDPF